MKKTAVTLPAEAVYLLGIVLLALAVAMLSAADFGVSMIVAPAYIVSLRFPVLTFGQAEYVVQAIVFVLLCLVVRRVKLVYFSSFLTGLIYGLVLDGWRTLPLFDPRVTPPGSMALPVRILLLIGGTLLTSFSVALFFETYLYPQVYDFFVKCVSAHFGLDRPKFKTAFDLSFLLLSVALTLLFFGRIRGVGVATLLIAPINGTLIGLCSKFFGRHLRTVPLFPRFARYFEL